MSNKKAKKRSVGEIYEKDEDEVIQLNVGGEKFTTMRSTLCQIEGSLLATMFSDRWQKGEGLQRDKDGYVFLDYKPKFFSVILDYLRERLYASLEQPPCIPVVPVEEGESFRKFVNYLGFAEELAFDQKPCVLSNSLRSFNDDVCIIQNDGCSLEADDSCDSNWLFAFSDNTYTKKGVYRWQLLYGNDYTIEEKYTFRDDTDKPAAFVGILKDDPEAYNQYINTTKKPEISFEPRDIRGSYGWVLNPTERTCEVVLNSRDVPIVQRKLILDDANRFELTLDLPRKILSLGLQNGRRCELYLPKDAPSTVWRLYLAIRNSTQIELM